MRIYVLLLSLIQLVAGDVSFVQPAGGEKYSAGENWRVSWKESNDAPLLSNLTYVRLSVYTGNNTNPIHVYTNFAIISTKALSMNALKFTLPHNFGTNLTLGYFVGITSCLNRETTSTVTNYSNRFTLTGMTGTLGSDVIGAVNVQGLEDTLGPSRVFKCGERTCSASEVIGDDTLGNTPRPTVTSTSDRSSSWDNDSSSINMKVAIALSVTLGALAVIFFSVTWWVMGRRMKHNESHQIIWWNHIPVPKFSAAELQERDGPYTTAELDGEEQRGLVYELQAVSIKRSFEDASHKTSVMQVEMSGASMKDVIESVPLKAVLVETEAEVIPKQEKLPNAVDELLPIARTSTYTSRCVKNHDPKYCPASETDLAGHSLRDTSPQESMAMLNQQLFDSTITVTPQILVTKSATISPTEQEPPDWSSPRDSTTILGNAELVALAGAFAPAPRAKPPRKNENWVYR